MVKRSVRTRFRRPGWLALTALLAIAMMYSLFSAGQTTAQDESNGDLTGEYTVSLSRTDVPTDIAGAFSYVGRWRIALNEDGTYEAERLDAGVVVQGTYTLSDDQITFTDESGLLSCSNPSAVPIEGDDLASGTYEWTKVGSEVTFTPVEDNCPGRVIFLSTFAFATYVACNTVPLAVEVPASPEASPVAVATSVPEPSATAESPLAVLTPEQPAESPTPGGGAESVDVSQIEPQIDELLSQMTACWATGDPDRWLPLLSNEFRTALESSDPEFRTTLAASMAAPIVWERAGDIDVESATQVSAIVRSTVGTEEDFQRFVFILEDGEWKWNG
jgi:hypothetical protein